MKPNPYDCSRPAERGGIVGIRESRINELKAEIDRLRKERDEARAMFETLISAIVREIHDMEELADDRFGGV